MSQIENGENLASVREKINQINSAVSGRDAFYVADTIADMASRQGIDDGSSIRVNSGFQGGVEFFFYSASSTLASNGATVVDATGVGVGRWISARRSYASFAELIGDVRTFDASTVLDVPSLGAVYEATDAAGSLGQASSGGQNFNVVSPTVYFEHFGALGDGTADDGPSMQLAFDSGLPLYGSTGAVYHISTPVALSDAPSVIVDLQGATVENAHATSRGIVISYPYGSPVSVTSVDLVAHSVVVSDATGFSVGQRCKIASNDRCEGNRPAPGDGSDYWQAQYVTVDDITGTTITFRENFEDDFTFATSPVLVAVNTKKAVFKNGFIKSEEGYADTRSNGLIRVEGGSNHEFKVTIENSNATAIQFNGCDGASFTGSVYNVGQSTDTSGGHGVSFISCARPRFDNSRVARCRHAFTTNDTPTQWADADFYQIGPSYDLSACGNEVTACWASGLSTHHGLRRGTIGRNVITHCAYGVGVRSWDTDILNNRIEHCGTSIFVYSESGVATSDKCHRAYLDGNRTKDATDQDLQVQRATACVIGSNIWGGGAPRGWFFNLSGTVVIHGDNDFWSSGTFTTDDNFLHTVSTPVEVRGTLSVDIDGMTTDGTNYAIYCTGDSDDFTADGKIIVDAPSGITDIFRHTGTSSVVLRELLYSGPSGNPIVASDFKGKVANRDGSYTYGLQTKTASASYDLGLLGSLHPQITVTLLTSGGSYTLASMDDGIFDGQRLVLRAIDTVGSNTFTLDASISNIDLRGADIVMADGDLLSFVWTGSDWVIESRTS